MGANQVNPMCNHTYFKNNGENNIWECVSCGLKIHGYPWFERGRFKYHLFDLIKGDVNKSFILEKKVWELEREVANLKTESAKYKNLFKIAFEALKKINHFRAKIGIVMEAEYALEKIGKIEEEKQKDKEK